MGEDLASMAQVVVENLHHTWLYRAIEGWCRKDALELREELGLDKFSITSSDPIEMYQQVKRHLLSKTFQDEEMMKFLMEAPRWAGFSLRKEEFQSGQQVIGAAKNEAIALLWLMAIPKMIVSPTVMPEDYPIDGIMKVIGSLMESDETREALVGHMSRAMESHGILDIVFEPSPIGRGYAIDDAMRTQRLRSLIAMVIMQATGYAFDIDMVFTLDEEQMVEEATAYVVAMQTKSILKSQITGGEGLRPFDWPLIGNPEICNRLFRTLDALQQYASQMTTCSIYSTEADGNRTPWNKREFASYLLHELAEHYLEIYRIRHGKSENPELELFIDLINAENTEIAKRLIETKKPGNILFEELSDYKQKAKVGEQPKISPERRFKVILSELKQRVAEDNLEQVSADELTDQIVEVFDTITEIVEGNRSALGDESDRFAQALCFETGYRILQLLDVGEALMDLPWVSRFIAEESARSDITKGDMSHLDDEHRIRRIISSYAGGVTYLILQRSK